MGNRFGVPRRAVGPRRRLAQSESADIVPAVTDGPSEAGRPGAGEAECQFSNPPCSVAGPGYALPHTALTRMYSGCRILRIRTHSGWPRVKHVCHNGMALKDVLLTARPRYVRPGNTCMPLGPLGPVTVTSESRL
jgi:hypothetical protein